MAALLHGHHGFWHGDAYSKYTPRASQLVSLMGKSFWAMHHYCWALVNLNALKGPLCHPFSGET